MSDIQRLISAVFPGEPKAVARPLESRGAHSNVAVEIAGNGTFVLRRYNDDGALCAKEAALLRALGALAPVPALVHADSSGEAGEPFLMYRFVEGLTFRELRDSAPLRESEEAAAAIGATLARLARSADGAASGLAARPAFGGDDVAHPPLAERVPADDRALLGKLLETWRDRLAVVFAERALVHGDFNHRNVVVRRGENGSWEVAAILDWELASAGSPLWDAARFICYEKPHAPVCEPSFSAAFAAAGVSLPADWPTFSIVLNTVAAASTLRDADLRSEFVPELVEFVSTRLRRLRDARAM